jgi:hypothetical protein
MTTIKRLLKTADDVATYRKQKAAMQKYKCPICRGPLQVNVTALDHSHKNGHCRSVLCRSCNVGEGKVMAGLKFRTTKTNLAYRDPVQWLRNLADYLEYHENNPSGIIHPTFDIKTGKQKPVKRKKRV